MAGFRRIVLVGAVLAIGIGGAKLQAQTQLADPRDAPRIFASTCSTCHKSPRGLAKTGQVAGFLRQHYTTGPEMSAAMAAYLVAAGSEPAARKGAETAQKQKGRKQDGQAEQAALTAPDTKETRETKETRTLRGRKRSKQEEPPPEPAQPAAAAPPAAEPERQAAAAPAASAAGEAPTETIPAPEPAGPPPVVFDIPLPEMPRGPPPDLTQSVFTSSPLP